MQKQATADRRKAIDLHCHKTLTDMNPPLTLKICMKNDYVERACPAGTQLKQSSQNSLLILTDNNELC